MYKTQNLDSKLKYQKFLFEMTGYWAGMQAEVWGDSDIQDEEGVQTAPTAD
jgi:hypothetical protein